MTQRAFDYLIFDWDGTISDSVPRIAECMQLAAREHHLPVPSHQQAANIVGLGLTEAINRLFSSIDPLLINAVSKTYSRHYRAKNKGPCHFFPHVLEILHQLKQQGYILAVATGKSEAGLHRELTASGLEDFFHATRCADQTASKPNPLMLKQLLDQTQLHPSQAIMIGDTEYDMEMAVNADMPRLAVSYGAHSADRLKKYQPIACIDCFSEIINYV